MSQAQYQSVAERALDNVRAEWVAESTPGTTPSDPSWNTFGDFIRSGPGYDGDVNATANEPSLGESDTERIHRGPRSGELSISWWMQQFFVTAGAAANDPIGEILNRSSGTELTTHTVVFRRENTASSVGNDSAGVRVYTVGRGCYPMSGNAPGDPSASEPIIAEAGYQAAIVETHVLHQPASGTTLEYSSTDDSDTMDITVENEGAGETETKTLTGTTPVSGTQSFTGLDAVWLSAEPTGDITVTDGSGTTFATIYGSNTDGVDGERGVPPLGSGSHASAIGTDPESYVFLGTSTTFSGSLTAANRIHGLDLTVEIVMTTEAQQGTRQMAIDPGVRTATVDADTAGPFESATRYKEYMQGLEGDITYAYPDGDVVIKNAQPTDVDERDYEAGDANNVFATAFAGQIGDDSAAVTASHN